MDDVRGAVCVTLYGPAEDFDRALSAIQQAGITAQQDNFEPNAIAAFFHTGAGQPSSEFVAECEARTRAAAQGSGFTVDRAGVWQSNAATRMLAYNRKTGEWLGAFIDTELPMLFRLELMNDIAESHGIDLNDIELRDPPELQIPER
ncbi:MULTISPECIES: hypothetical protein [Streptomyces]|uniref:Uncharacterized protein n=1 Tax=Streptomyces rugosispiralis TaxID=2967341 RepID=A0ABT1UYC2_9ACTN|nr:hypothetical protein [Streptomyces rugosispiralis]MCQ8190122.1 hypothetical protein [Streptomyces rugosispiralis]